MKKIKCPYCNADIENDSLFCDHCGRELYICPTCKTYGSGKFCRNDGNTLVPAHLVLPAPPPVSQPTPTVVPTETTINPEEAPLVLKCSEQSITLTLDDGATIGRRSAATNQLSQFGMVSGQHASVKRVNGQWMITDQGSSNGTWVANQRVAQGTSHPLTRGDVVRIASLQFTVE